jgi:hypothetical protein
MCFVTLNCAVVWIDSCKLDIFAKVVATVLAKKAFAAGNTRFDRHAITWIDVSASLDIQ